MCHQSPSTKCCPETLASIYIITICYQNCLEKMMHQGCLWKFEDEVNVMGIYIDTVNQMG